MFLLEYKSSFVRDVQTYEKRGGDTEKLQHILRLLKKGDALPPSLRDHQLHGRLRRCRELHVMSDWLLVYEKDGKKLIITCLWLTTHNQLRRRERG